MPNSTKLSILSYHKGGSDDSAGDDADIDDNGHLHDVEDNDDDDDGQNWWILISISDCWILPFPNFHIFRHSRIICCQESHIFQQPFSPLCKILPKN